MKTLTLLRHAKSGWDDPVPRDFDRPLNPKGRRAATLMGRHLRDLELEFDRVVASPAVRVVETIGEVASGYGRPIAPVWDKRIYLASAETLLDIVRETDAAAAGLLLIGHNPGLEELATALIGDGPGDLRAAIEAKYPTATVTELRFDGDWIALDARSATLTRFVRPRDLDPTLGPDAD